MIKINVTDEQLALAKEETIKFDEQKTYNKFECNTNYRGLLGEMVMSQWMKDNNIKHTWIEFTKQGWNEPDFVIEDKTIDLKTTVSEYMWMPSKIVHDIYVYANCNRDDKTITIHSWITYNELINLKRQGYNTISVEQMQPIQTLWGTKQ